MLAHGLAGSYGMWASLAEFLASRGYIVAAPTFISDGGLPLVFHDPDSAFANAASAEELQNAYATILGEIKVAPYFFRLVVRARGGGVRRRRRVSTRRTKPSPPAGWSARRG